jgi:hypothetical protein
MGGMECVSAGALLRGCASYARSGTIPSRSEGWRRGGGAAPPGGRGPPPHTKTRAHMRPFFYPSLLCSPLSPAPSHLGIIRRGVPDGHRQVIHRIGRGRRGRARGGEAGAEGAHARPQATRAVAGRAERRPPGDQAVEREGGGQGARADQKSQGGGRRGGAGPPPAGAGPAARGRAGRGRGHGGERWDEKRESATRAGRAGCGVNARLGVRGEGGGSAGACGCTSLSLSLSVCLGGRGVCAGAVCACGRKGRGARRIQHESDNRREGSENVGRPHSLPHLFQHTGRPTPCPLGAPPAQPPSRTCRPVPVRRTATRLSVR